MYFNVIRELIDEDMYYIFKNGTLVLHEGFDIPEWIDELFIVKISGTEDVHGDELIFECC